MIRERSFSWSDPKLPAEAARAMAGLDLMRALRDGAVPPPPAIDLVGISLTEADEGRVVMSLAPAEYHYNLIGTMHGGIMAALVDSAMGCAVHTTLPRGRGYTSLEIKVNYLRAVTDASGMLSAEGKVVHGGSRSAVAEARVVDANGRLCATASTTCLLFDLPAS